MKKVRIDGEEIVAGAGLGFALMFMLSMFGWVFLETGGRVWIADTYRDWNRPRTPASITEICAPEVKGTTDEIISEYRLNVWYSYVGPTWRVSTKVKTGGASMGTYEMDVEMEDADLARAVRECARRVERVRALDSTACAGGAR